MTEYVIYDKASGTPLQVHVEPEGKEQRDEDSIVEEALASLGREQAPEGVAIARLGEGADLPDEIRALLQGPKDAASTNFGGGGGGLASGSEMPVTGIKPVFTKRDQ